MLHSHLPIIQASVFAMSRSAWLLHVDVAYVCKSLYTAQRLDHGIDYMVFIIIITKMTIQEVGGLQVVITRYREVYMIAYHIQSKVVSVRVSILRPDPYC